MIVLVRVVSVKIERLKKVIIKNNVDLSLYSHMKIGGMAKKMYFPENIEDLMEVYHLDNRYIIANGSNVLINEREFECVINLSKMSNEIEKLDQLGRYRIGAAVKIPTMVNHINKDGYGGPEFLYCVPGTIGGAVFMNAGLGAHRGMFVSNFIESVMVYTGEDIISLSLDECQFSYRSSVFHNKPWIILSVDFKFPEMSQEESQKGKEERINHCKNTQDRSGGNLGSIFCIANGNILQLVRKLGYGKKNGAHFSKKSSDWIVNSGEGTFKEVMKCIEFVEKLHKIFRQKIKREVIIWN